jgi:hypothetical protein
MPNLLNKISSFLSSSKEKIKETLRDHEKEKREKHLVDIALFKESDNNITTEEMVDSLLWYFQIQLERIDYLGDEIPNTYFMEYEEQVYGLKYRENTYLTVEEQTRLNTYLKSLDLRDVARVFMVSVTDNYYTLRKYLRYNARGTDKEILSNYLVSVINLLKEVKRREAYAVLTRIRFAILVALSVNEVVDELVIYRN